MRRKHLGRVIRDAMEVKGIRWEDLAEAAGMKPSTMRTCCARNTFPRDVAAKLLAATGLEMTIEEAELTCHTYGDGKGWTRPRKRVKAAAGERGLQELFRQSDHASRRIGTYMQSNSVRLAEAYRSMGEGCLFIYFSAMDSPVEFEPHLSAEVLPALAGAIGRQAMFVYFRGDDEVLEEYREAGMSRVPLDNEWFRNEFTQFRASVEAHLVQAHSRTIDDAKRLVRERLFQFFCKRSAFWVPGFSFGLFQEHRPPTKLSRRVTVRLPETYGGVFFMPSDVLLEQRFEMSVRHVLDEIDQRRDVTQEERDQAKVVRRLMLI